MESPVGCSHPGFTQVTLKILIVKVTLVIDMLSYNLKT